MIRQGDGTTWIFYYGFDDKIFYEKKARHGKATRHSLTINGNAVVGSHTELAATLWQDSVREISMSLWSPFCFPKFFFFLFFFALAGCEEVIITFLRRMFANEIFFVPRLISPVSTILTEASFFAKLTYKELLATNGWKVPYPTTTGRLLWILLSLPSAQGNSREKPVSSSGSFSMNHRP